MIFPFVILSKNFNIFTIKNKKPNQQKMTDAIFRKDRRSWTASDQQQIQYFFQCNEFFSKFYEHHYFQNMVQLAYYSKVTSQSPLYLTDNKRPVAIVLLKGQIAVHRRETYSPSKRGKIQLKLEENGNGIGHGASEGGIKNATKQLSQNPPEFIKTYQCLQYNQTVIQSLQCKVATLHCHEAEIIFIPLFIYNNLLAQIKDDKDKIIFNMLSKIFKSVQNRYVMELARSGCKVKQLKINSYIYEQGQKPQSVYLIIEGSAKIQRPGFSHRHNLQIVVVSSQSLLGQKDICYTQRQSSAVCCSAFIRLLQIPKQAFLRFAKICLPDLKIQHKDNSLTQLKNKKQSSSMPSSPKNRKQHENKLPIIMRFRSARRSEEEQQRQYNLIKNSHVLLQACKPRKDKVRSRSTFQDYPKDMMEEKIKLFKKLRPVQTKLDLSNRIF